MNEKESQEQGQRKKRKKVQSNPTISKGTKGLTIFIIIGGILLLLFRESESFRINGFRIDANDLVSIAGKWLFFISSRKLSVPPSTHLTIHSYGHPFFWPSIHLAIHIPFYSIGP